MAKRVFYSFHYKPDCVRVSQIRNIGAIEDNKPAHDNDWETITKQGDPAIEKWIADQMYGRSCTVLMIGAETADRKWIDHEIRKTWADKKGLVGVYIHNLKNFAGQQSAKGANPFAGFTLNNGKSRLPDDAFIMDAKLSVPGLFPEAFKALVSFSIWPFYGGLAVGLWLLKARLWGDL